MRWSILSQLSHLFSKHGKLQRNSSLLRKYGYLYPAKSFKFIITESRWKEILLLFLELFIKVDLQLIRFILKKQQLGLESKSAIKPSLYSIDTLCFIKRNSSPLLLFLGFYCILPFFAWSVLMATHCSHIIFVWTLALQFGNIFDSFLLLLILGNAGLSSIQ